LMSTFKYVTGPDVPTSHLPFSAAVQAGDFLFVSGQASVDLTGKIIPGSFEEECRRSFDNVRAIVKAAGFAMEDIVQVKNYVGRQEDLPQFQEIYKEYFNPPYPARTTIMG